ncbi:hypothetical protein [Paenibacillus popilliae]|nr:hypothetical protein [Paenibacillus popilliae]
MDKISMKTDIYLGQGAPNRLTQWWNQRIFNRPIHGQVGDD